MNWRHIVFMINILNMKQYKQILEAINRGIQLALDDYEDNELNSSLSQHNDVIDSEDVIKQKYDLMKKVVDLGLPSGTLWCKYNLGETAITLGGYYAWGETQPKETYDWDTYEHGYGPYSLYKYVDNTDNAADDNDNKIDDHAVLLPEDDAATQNIHLYDFKFHIPTKEQFEELINYTGIKYKDSYEDPKTISNGVWLISKINGNKIFFPFGQLKGIKEQFMGGYYWSSTLKPGFNNNAYHLTIGSNFAKVEHNEERYIGMLIRPVLNLK